jgi:hypothetical protein
MKRIFIEDVYIIIRKKEKRMKKKPSIIAVAVLLVGFAFWISANADTVQDQTNPAPGHHWIHAKHRPDLLARYVRRNMAAQAISDLTKVPVDTIRQKLQQERLPALLQEYRIDWTAFSSAVQARVQDLLGTLVNGNYLTADQRSQIQARMEQRARRRALLKSVVDKALTEGTITADQAQMLTKRP